MPVFKPRRQTFRYCQTNLAPPDKVFPLLCPVRESDWLDGWQAKIIYSESGLAEKDCVFHTSMPNAEDAFWVITRYDREARGIAFARFMPGKLVSVLEIDLAPCGSERSEVHIAYTHTAVAPEGNQWIEGLTEEDFIATMRFWENAINHYLTTGKMLKRKNAD